MPEEAAATEGKPPGQSPGRIGSFVDAVLAIAMTLLVIDIPRPDSAMFSVGPRVSKDQAFDNLGTFIWHQHQALYAYVLAFFILWIVWRQHHSLFDQYDRISSAMVGWHFPLLLFAAFLTYTTSIFRDYGDNPMAALLYGVNLTVILLCRSLVQTEGLRGGVLIPEANLVQYRTDVTVAWVVVAYWVVSLTLVWWTPWSEIPWVFSSLAATAARRVIRRRAAPAQLPR